MGPDRFGFRIGTNLIFSLVVAMVTVSLTPAPTANNTTWFNTENRTTVIEAYHTEFSRAVPPMGWEDGDTSECRAGRTSSAFRQATIDRVNYFRAMAGVKAAVVEDGGFSVKAQITAVMMSAQDELSHDPSSDYACYTTVAKEGAGHSNLYLGRTGPRAVNGYIEDPGDGNTDVGHRTTILHPPTRRMGIGDVAASDNYREANTLWVFDDHVFDETNPDHRPPMREPRRFVAWPPRGFVPQDIVYPRWSVTVADVDFSEAEVSMFRHTKDGPEPVPLTVVDRVGKPGHVPLPTIVWEPEISPASSVDIAYTVVVTNLGSMVAKADRLTLPAELAFSDEDLGTSATTSDPSAEADSGSTVFGRAEPLVYTVQVLGARPHRLFADAEALTEIERYLVADLESR